MAERDYKVNQDIEYLHPDGAVWRPGIFLGWESPGLAKVMPAGPGEAGFVPARRLRPAPRANVYASMTWPARWNDGEQVAALSQSGAEVMATGFFGTLMFRLDEPGSAEAIVRYARAFATMVENAKLDYDTAWMASAPADDRNSLD